MDKLPSGATKFGAVVLAAGGSARMGAPKQLLNVRGESLVAHAVAAVAGAGIHPIAVVVGAHSEMVEGQVDRRVAQVVVNPDWATGMASSIRAGVAALVSGFPGLGAILVTPCDQPALSAGAVRRLMGSLGGADQIVASRYNGRLGSPALFGSGFFEALLALSGDQGARALLNAPSSLVIPIDLPELGLDLDTPKDLEVWKAAKGSE